VNPRVHKRHNDLVKLVSYLFSEGKDDDHTDAHLVAAWDGAGDLKRLEPPDGHDRRRDVCALVNLLAQPVHATRIRPQRTVWHCSIRNAPEDRLLTDPAWAEVARQVMDATGLAPIGDARAVRWVAVRHSPNHIHLVATLVRQDGRTAWGWRDMINARQRCYELEDRYGLRRVAPMDRTSQRYPNAAELNKAKRLGRPMTARDELRRHVRAASVAAANEHEFFARLGDSGVLVTKRFSVTNPGEVTGYSVALAGSTNAIGRPVFYGGGKLARDLTLPRLRQRWARPDQYTALSVGTIRVSAESRVQAFSNAADAIRGAASAMGQIAATDPAGASGIAQATADTLTAIASAVEGRRGGPLTSAAELFDRAAREPYGHVAPPTRRSVDLRALSRLVHLMGRATGGDAETRAMLTLLLDLARLADTVSALRAAQDRHHQADDAARAAQTLRAAAATDARLIPTPHLSPPDLDADRDPTPPVDLTPSTWDEQHPTRLRR
jgi:hypothetical protein